MMGRQGQKRFLSQENSLVSFSKAISCGVFSTKLLFVLAIVELTCSGWVTVGFPVSQRRQRYGGVRSLDSSKVIVIGGGWAGFSAADALSKLDGVEVELLDASRRGPGGLAAGWSSQNLNLPVEAGIHGFWREYRNTFDVIQSIGLELDEVLTPFTPSILVSETGRVALAPVLGETDSSVRHDNPRGSTTVSSWQSMLDALARDLPPPLDVAVRSRFDNAALSSADRLSAVGLLGAWADFGQEDDESWDRYDKLSADQLFRDRATVSPRLYQQLVSPLLHVLPMTPGYDCSAAAALSCFHVFALQSKGAFDVRWCRGTITEKIFDPWSRILRERNVTVQGSSRVTAIVEDAERKMFTVSVNNETDKRCDAVVLAVGTTAARRLAVSCPPLTALSQTNEWDGSTLRGITCVAVRLFLQASSSWVSAIRAAMSDSPVVVCGPRIGGIPQLAETGFCIYDLQRLQDFFATKFEDAELFTIEVDYYRADAMVEMSDETVVELAFTSVSAALSIKPPENQILKDFSVVRARNAVSHFCVGSASASPNSTRLRRGMYICGDWVERKGHASWSTEKAVVTGRRAATAFAQDFTTSDSDVIPPTIPAATDTPQLAALRKGAKAARQFLPFLEESIPSAPWVGLL
jgi:uncharacterized protein with NAD-binding domain and iron-sulfur cluster